MNKQNFFIWILTFSLLIIVSIQPPNAQAQILSPEENGWKEIAVGNLHSLGIKDDGTVWQWGNITTYRGALGSETNLNSYLPVQVPFIKNTIAVAGGQTHSLALTNEGTVWAWGGNLDGQLGDGSKVSRESPKQIEKLFDVVAIEANWTSSYAIKKMAPFGSGAAFFPKVPTQLPGAADVISISAGYGNFMLLKKDGTVWTYNNKMVRVEGLEGIVQIAVGGSYTYGMKKDGTIWLWGSNGFGKVNGSSLI